MGLKALIPVRSGSERVKNKNIRPFAGSSLLEIKIRQLKRIQALGLIDGVVVNSNCEKMLAIADALGAETIKRDDYFATSEISPNELYVNMASKIVSKHILIAHVTSPLISDLTISRCISIYKNQYHYDSVATSESIKKFLWLNNESLNYDKSAKPRSQDLPPVIAINHAINILPRETMILNKDIIGYSPYFYTIEQQEAMDIDTEMDFEIAEFLFNKYRGGGGGIKCFSYSAKIYSQKLILLYGAIL